MDESTTGDLYKLATTTATDCGVVATLTDANSSLTIQLKDLSNELKEVKALLKK
jgi:hypothetical protein